MLFKLKDSLKIAILKFTHLELYFIDLTSHPRKRRVIRMCYYQHMISAAQLAWWIWSTSIN